MVSSSSEVSGNGVSRGASIVAIVASLTGISAIFVAARLFVRIKMMRSLGLDDYLIILAMVCAFVNLGISSAAAASGSGRHFDNLSVEEQQNTIKYTIAAFCPGILSFAIPKLAVVALLAKLLNPTRMHRIFLWVFSGVTTAVLFGCVIILYAQCTPARSQWDFSVEGECWSIWILINYAIFAGALSAFVDLYLAVYPACILFKLQMSAQKKIGLGIALGIGSVACIVAAYKCTRIPGLATKDFSYHTADLVVWTCVEGSTIIIASCIPILQPLVKVVMGKNAFSSARYVGGGYSGQTPRKRATRPSDITLSGDLGNFGKSYTRTKIGVSQNAETGSQERILQEEIPAESDRGQSAQAKIIRTDEITISSSPAEGTLNGQ